MNNFELWEDLYQSVLVHFTSRVSTPIHKHGSKMKTANGFKTMFTSHAQDSPELCDRCRLRHRHGYSADAPNLWEAMVKTTASSSAY